MHATTCTPRAMPGATRLLAVQLGMVLAWSSGFVGYRYAMEQAPVFLTSFWRFAVCLALLLPFAWAGLRRLSARQWRRQALIGALAYAGYIAPIAKAIELGVSPGVAALMADLLPLLVALLALVLPGQRTRPGQWPGIALGVAGVLWAGHAALALALATLLQKRWDDAPGSLAVVLFVQIGAALPAFAGLALGRRVACGRRCPADSCSGSPGWCCCPPSAATACTGWACAIFPHRVAARRCT